MSLTPVWQRRLTRLIELLIGATVLVAAIVLWRWYRDGGGFEAIYVAIGVALAALWAMRRRLRQDQETAPQRDLLSADALQNPRNRENLLNHVHTAWIEGFLRQSIHSEVLKLSLSYRPEAVGQRPWQLVLKQQGQTDQPVPPERSLLDIFNGSGRNLLILGEPGSGKTITMLQLAESLIEAARQNPAEPLPIILNLSSWAWEKKPLAEWMVEEVFVQHGIARDLIRTGIASNQFLYLLDGLDEVAAEARDACIEAINTFKETHLAEIVLCSRTAEYEALQNKLFVGMGVQIRPLSDAQIDEYLGHDGLELQAVRATLKHDADLRELAKTPLMLSLMTLAYRGLALEDMSLLKTSQARRHHIFTYYVDSMFQRYPVTHDNLEYKEQAIMWLSHLAQTMQSRKQSVFFIEQLQPEMLPGSARIGLYPIFVGLITFCLFIMSSLLVNVQFTIGVSAVFNLGIDDVLDKFFLGEQAAAAAGFLPSGVTYDDFSSIYNTIMLPLCMFYSLIIGFINGLTSFRPIRLVESLSWSWRSAIYSLPLLLTVSYMFAVLLSGIANSMISILFPMGAALPFLSIFMLVLGTSGFLLIIAALWFRIESVPILGKHTISYQKWYSFGVSVTEVSRKKRPNEGIYRTIRNGLKVTLLIGVLGGVSYTLYTIIVFYPVIGILAQPGDTAAITLVNFVVGILISSIPIISTFVLTAGTVFGLIFGFNTVIKHYTLRVILSMNGMFPLRIQQFLDAMHKRIFLRRVGGGWIFIHRSVMEYFASLAAVPK